jgi:hypothetical protein
VTQAGGLRALPGSIGYLLLGLVAVFVCGCCPEPHDKWDELDGTRQAAFKLAHSDARPLEASQLPALLGDPVVKAPFEHFIAELAVSPHGTRQTDDDRLAVIHQLQRDGRSISVVSRRAERSPPPLREREVWVYDPQDPFARVAPEGRPATIFFTHNGTVWGSTDLILWQEK